MNPAPILWAEGTIHTVRDRHVEAYEGRTGGRDAESGRWISPRPARAGYDVKDLTVLTSEGGFALVVIMPEALDQLEGDLTGLDAGKQVRLPVRGFVNYVGDTGARRPVPGFSLAGDVFKDARSKTGGGARALSSATA
jgi:hypothetical protein